MMATRVLPMDLSCGSRILAQEGTAKTFMRPAVNSLQHGESETREDKPDEAVYRRTVSEYRTAADYFSGDFYPLTPYSKAVDVLIAWEFIFPERGDGTIQAFEREFTTSAKAQFKLYGLIELSETNRFDCTEGKPASITL